MVLPIVDVPVVPEVVVWVVPVVDVAFVCVISGLERLHRHLGRSIGRLFT